LRLPAELVWVLLQVMTLSNHYNLDGVYGSINPER